MFILCAPEGFYANTAVTELALLGLDSREHNLPFASETPVATPCGALNTVPRFRPNDAGTPWLNPQDREQSTQGTFKKSHVSVFAFTCRG